MDKQKTLKELVKESGITIKALAKRVECDDNHLRACLNGNKGKNLSPLREKLIREYLEKVIAI